MVLKTMKGKWLIQRWLNERMANNDCGTNNEFSIERETFIVQSDKLH